MGPMLQQAKAGPDGQLHQRGKAAALSGLAAGPRRCNNGEMASASEQASGQKRKNFFIN
jgi:hypothetical protein